MNFSVYVWWDVFHIEYQHSIFGVHDVGYRLFVYRQHLQLEVAVRCSSVNWANFWRCIDDYPDLYDVPDFCNLWVIAEYRVDSRDIQPRSLLASLWYSTSALNDPSSHMCLASRRTISFGRS